MAKSKKRKKVRQSEAEAVEKRLTQYSPMKPKNRMAKSGMIILEAKRVATIQKGS